MSGKIKYGVIGYKGRLGSEVVNVFKENKHSLVYTYDLDGVYQTGKPDVIIDCSLPDVLEKTISTVTENKIPLVLATTGLSTEQLDMLREISNSIPVVQSYNFSTGIQILLKLTQIASEKLPGWDVEIEETHHRFKKDKPSGTAKMIENILKDRSVNISSLRLGNVPGDHTVSFGGLGEVLSIKHSATSRRTFAEGILRSAEFVVKKDKGFFSFTDVVFGE